MGQVIYWKEYDEPKKYYDPILKKELVSTGMYVCEDERVDKFWMYGSTSVNPIEHGMNIRGAIVMKNGDRWEGEPIRISIDPDNAQEATDTIISQAEQYLKELK